MSPLRVWKRSKELTGVLPSAEGGPGADLILPQTICDTLGGAVPFAMHLAAKSLTFWLPFAGFFRRLILIWYRWRLIRAGASPGPGVHFDLVGRVIASPEASTDAPLAALNF